MHTFTFLSYTWLILAVIIFFLLLRITAPYGRHSSDGWGPMIDNRLGWLMMEIPVLIIFSWYLFPHVGSIPVTTWVMTGLFFLHYLNRIFIFPFRLHTKGKKIPLLIVGSAIFFNLINGASFGYYFTHVGDRGTSWFTDIRFITGLILFLTGMYINWKADIILIRLRKPGETHYMIPAGWLFERISCPNLFGELVEWSGFALLCWNLPSLVFLTWTAANLIPRALSHHRWYKNKFSEYPAQRKAIIPYIL